MEGYGSVEYRVGARAGQRMTVDLKATNGSAYFNLFAPGVLPGEGTAIFIGSEAGSTFQDEVAETGDYTVQVYLMRNAARRHEAAAYALRVAVVGAGGGDAKVPGTDFHATAAVPCSPGGGQPTGPCEAGVTRRSDGSATVLIALPDGRKRAIFFRGNQATGYAEGQAEGGIALSVVRVDDLSLITIGSERYEIPDAFVLGD